MGLWTLGRVGSRMITEEAWMTMTKLHAVDGQGAFV